MTCQTKFCFVQSVGRLVDLVLSSRHPFSWKFSDTDVRNSLLVLYQVVYVTRSVEELATVQRRRKETV